MQNKFQFERVKAPQFNDRELGCIDLILPNSRSLNFGSFHAAEIGIYFS